MNEEPLLWIQTPPASTFPLNYILYPVASKPSAEIWVLSLITNLTLTNRLSQLFNHASVMQLCNVLKIRSFFYLLRTWKINHALQTIVICCIPASLNTTSKLQLDQNAAARVLTKSNRRVQKMSISASLHWLPVHFRIDFKI